MKKHKILEEPDFLYNVYNNLFRKTLDKIEVRNNEKLIGWWNFNEVPFNPVEIVKYEIEENYE